ncbi:MAG TPA: hypothetical protein VF678_10765, partial [bacterium]
MEDQTRVGRRQAAWRVAVVTGMAAALAASACGGPVWTARQAVRPDERTPQTYCATERSEAYQGRVINYVDPELCGRYVRDRSDYTVRVPPIVRPTAQGAR